MEASGLETAERADGCCEGGKRPYEIDVLTCPGCGGRLRLLATIEEPQVVRKILSHLGIPTECPEPLPARAPPWAAPLFPPLSDVRSG